MPIALMSVDKCAKSVFLDVSDSKGEPADPVAADAFDMIPRSRQSELKQRLCRLGNNGDSNVQD